MYNWCLNKVKITGKEENLKKVRVLIWVFAVIAQ